MKRVLIGIAAAASLFATSALAADLPVKAPYMKAPIMPVFNWTGFYVGGNLGYGWGDSNFSTTIDRFATGLPFSPTINGTTSVSNDNNVRGVVGGGQFGYNWQIDRSWLVGLETDIQGSGVRGSSGPITCLACADIGTNIVTSFNEKLEWFGTARGRVGVLVTPDLLFYGTGGLAYGEVNINGTTIGDGAGGTVAVVLPGVSSTRAGWTAGGGAEGHLWDAWTVKFEYLYMDLGHLSDGPLPLTGILVNPRVLAGLSYTSHITENMFRVGVNYHFGGPVVAKY